jgi:hypothetical protein
VKNKLFTIFSISITSLVAVFFISAVLRNSPFSTLSPDSIRFFHFWQINFDFNKSQSIGISETLRSFYFSLKSSTLYDISRGRYFQYIIYGIDGCTRWMFPSQSINYIMIILLIINSLLISYCLVKHNKLNNKIKNLLFILIFLLFFTSSYIVSPVILLNLYGKYLWVLFILLYFVFNHKRWSFIFLIASLLTDELGLISSLVIFSMIIFSKSLIFFIENRPLSTWLLNIRNSFLISLLSSVVLFFTFYGFSAILFNVGSGFASLAYGFTGEAVNSGLINLLEGIGWSLNVHAIGYSTVNKFLIYFSLIIFLVLLINFLITNTKELNSNNNYQNDKKLLIWLQNEKLFFFSFWLIMFILINTIIIPGGVNDFSHRSFPRAVTIFILTLFLLLELDRKKIVASILILFTIIHFLNFKKIVYSTSENLKTYLLPDSSITFSELNKINYSVNKIVKYNDETLFNKINNNEEIDFSGTWFYSRLKNFDTTCKMYYPIEGTVRVLIWPKKLSVKKSKRIFEKKRPAFFDIH